MGKKLYYVYLIIYLFLMIYKPAIFSISMNYTMLAWAVVGIFFNTKGILAINKNFIKSNRFLLQFNKMMIIICGYLIIGLFFTSKDFSLLKFYYISFANVIEIYYAFILFNKCKLDKNGVVRLIIIVGLIQSFICIIMVMLPNIRLQVLNYIFNNMNDPELLVRAYDERIYGIAGEYLYTIGLIHGFMALISFRYIIENKSIQYAILTILLIIPAFLNARVGVICCLISISIVVICVLIFGKMEKKVKIIKSILVSIILIVALSYLCQMFIPNTFSWIIYGFQSVMDLVTGTENKYYGSLTSSFIFWPKGLNFIIGSGTFPSGKDYFYLYGVTSDIGYVLDVYIGGIILSILFYSLCVKIIVTGWKNKQLIDKVFIISSIVFMALANYKGRIAGAYDFLFLVFMYFRFEEYLYKDNKKSVMKCKYILQNQTIISVSGKN